MNRLMRLGRVHRVHPRDERDERDERDKIGKGSNRGSPPRVAPYRRATLLTVGTARRRSRRLGDNAQGTLRTGSPCLALELASGYAHAMAFRTEADLLATAESQEAEEGDHLELKRELPPGDAATREI